MKKIYAIITILALSTVAQAQSRFDPLASKETFTELMRSTVILILIYLLSVFILSFIRLFLNDRLKRTMLQRETPPDMVAMLLPKQNGPVAGLKWFCVLTAIAIGLIIVSLNLSSGIYVAIVMTFSIALGFLGYYFLAKWLNN